ENPPPKRPHEPRKRNPDDQRQRVEERRQHDRQRQRERQSSRRRPLRQSLSRQTTRQVVVEMTADLQRRNRPEESRDCIQEELSLVLAQPSAQDLAAEFAREERERSLPQVRLAEQELIEAISVSGVDGADVDEEREQADDRELDQ